MSEEEILRRATIALVPCSVRLLTHHYSTKNYDTKIIVAWAHPNGGRNAISARQGEGEQLVDIIERSRNGFVATVEWAHVRDLTFWERITIWFRPLRRAEVYEKHAALRAAAEADSRLE